MLNEVKDLQTERAELFTFPNERACSQELVDSVFQKVISSTSN